jgi:hypothetical protein
MNNWCVCWFFTRIFTWDFNFKGLTAQRLYKSFGVKGLIYFVTTVGVFSKPFSKSEYVKPNNIMINGLMNWRGREMKQP